MGGPRRAGAGPGREAWDAAPPPALGLRPTPPGRATAARGAQIPPPAGQSEVAGTSATQPQSWRGSK